MASRAADSVERAIRDLRADVAREFITPVPVSAEVLVTRLLRAGLEPGRG